MASVKRRGALTRVTLGKEEAAVVAGFAREVADLLAVDDADDDASQDPLVAITGLSEVPVAVADDPAVRRLLPDAYDDAEQANEFRRLTDTELRRGKCEALHRLSIDVEEAGGRVDLDDEGADEWLRALNDIRLVLGVRLDITEDDRSLYDAMPSDDPRRPLMAAYDWLTWLQDALIHCVSDA